MEAEILKVWNEMNTRLTNFVNDKVQDSELSKDIVQDVFIKVFSKSDTLKDKNKLVSWIYQVIRNEIMNHFRKNKHYSDFTEIKEEENIQNNLTSELSEYMHPMINSLPDKYKDV